MAAKQQHPKQRKPDTTHAIGVHTWLKYHEQVLALVFEGRKTYTQIAAACGVSASTVDRLVRRDEFKARLAAMREAFVESLTALRVPYVRKEQRIMGLAQMAESARQEYEARPLLREIRPLPQKASVRIRMVRPVDTDASHQDAHEPDAEITEPLDAIVNESFNRDAHAAYREALADIAAELGDRKQKMEVSGTVAHLLVPAGAVKVLADELLDAVRGMPEARAALAQKLLTSGGSIDGGE